MKWTMATLVGTLAFIGFTALAHADESQNTVKIDDVKPGRNQLQDDNVDEILTNNLLRAQTGSKSRWSVSNSITYNGGTIDEPFNAYIPNISAGTGLTNVANMTDSVSIKYRQDTQSSWMAGIGARWISPFNGTQVPTGYNGNKYDAYNPYLHYQYVYRWSAIQNAFTTGPTITTYNNLTRMGYVGNWLVQQTSVYEIGNTGLSLGALYYSIYAAYNSESDPYRSDISDYTLAFEPFIEYQLTPKINLRTFFGLLSYEHIVSEPNALTFHKDTFTQSFGVGISVIRDVFLYPNITFIPYDIRADRTNFGVSANVNLF